MYKNSLLSMNNAKTVKGEKIINEVTGLPYKTAILYLSPHTGNSKQINLCSHASAGCIESCLFGSGLGVLDNVKQGRIDKTEFLLNDRKAFLNKLVLEIKTLLKAVESKYTLVIRLNGTSDVLWERYNIIDGKNIFELFPNVTFYDYTKNHLRFNKVLPSNYHLTFSRNEINENKSIELLKKGFNVAVVFKGGLPETYKGFKVINGDLHDLRFIDGKNVVVGLKYKSLTGKGADNSKGLKSGFVIDNTFNKILTV